MRRRWFERLKSLVVYVLTTAFVLLAVAATALRLAVAYAPELRSETEAYLGQWLDRPVSIGGLRAEWQGLDPRLIFEDVVVTGEGSSGYSFAELEVSLSARQLVTAGRIEPSEVAVSGVELTVERLPGGELEFSANREPSFLATLPARIRVSDATVRIIDHVRANVYALTDASLLFSREDSRHRLSITARPPAFIGERAEFILRWSKFEDPFADARLYADLKGFQFDALQKLGVTERAIPGLRGAGDMELWIRGLRGRITSATGRINLLGLGAEQGSGKDWFDIGRKLEARFDWRRTEAGWALDVDEIGYAVEQELWPTSGLSVRYQRETGTRTERWRAGVEYIELSRMRQLLANLPRVPEAVHQWAEAVELGGELRQAGLQVGLRDDRVTDYAAHGTLTGGRYVTGDGRYAVSGMDASFTANERGGEARINGRDGRLKLANLFRDVLPYNRFEAEAAWARDGPGWRLGLSGVSLRNADGAVRGGARLFDLGTDNPFLDIRSSAQRFDAAATSRYVPAGIMDQELVDWLDQAFLGGRAEGAELLFFGRVDDFPFRDGGRGVFEVRGQVTGGRMSYFPEWPEIHDVAADLRFTGVGMEITARSGRIRDADIERAVASIDSFRDARLSVEGVAVGRGDDYLAFLRQAPITRDLAPELERLRLSGRHRLDLALGLPLKSIDDSRVDGRLNLDGGTLTVADAGVSVAGLGGPVRFDEQGLDIDELSGQWRGERVDFRAETLGQGEDAAIAVSALLNAGADVLVPQLQSLITGRTRWTAKARLPGFQSERAVNRVPVEVSSDLAGLGIQLPGPLGKAAADSRPLQMWLALTREGMAPVTVNYGPDVTIRADPGKRADSGVRYGVHFGAGEPELPEGTGVRLTGHLDSLALEGIPAMAGRGTDTAGEPGLRAWVDLSVGRLTFAGQRFRELSLVGTVQPAAISMRLSGPDVAGELNVPLSGASPVGSVELSYLRLSKDGVDTANDGVGTSASWRSLPSLDLSIDELYLDGQRLGRFTAVVDAGADETRLREFSLDNRAIAIQGSGGWQHAAASEHSWLEASFESPDVGRALSLFGYARTVEGGNSNGRMRLDWAGGPLSLSPAKLHGELEFTMKDGRLPEVQPGAGRVFGLLSLATIPRRLTLDFSDLFQEGFTFDRIQARFRLDEGIAQPRLFFIEGPAARIDFSGDIDLIEQRFDQILTVTPQVSSTLPLIGGIAGGPVAAAVLFVTQQIFQDEMDQIARYRFRVTGPWQAPDIEPIRRRLPEGVEGFDDFPDAG